MTRESTRADAARQGASSAGNGVREWIDDLPGSAANHPSFRNPLARMLRIACVDDLRNSARQASRAAAAGLHQVGLPSRLGSVAVHASERGGETALLLLHGAAGSWSTWLPLIEEAERVGRPLTNVVAIDLPGWGESGGVPDQVSVEAMTGAIVDVVTALGYSEWTAIGHSLGGHLALDLAARVPESTRAVILVSATGPDAVEVLRHPFRSFATLPWLAGMLAAMRVLSVFGPLGLGFVRWLHQVELLRLLSAPLFAFPRRVDEAVIDGLSREVRPQAFLRAAVAACDFDERVWCEIRCPVLVLRGERDVFVGPGDAVWFDEHLVLVSHAVIPGAGHFAHAEQPGLVLDRILSAAALTR